MKHGLALIVIIGVLSAPGWAGQVMDPAAYSVQRLEMDAAAVGHIVFTSDTGWIGTRVGVYSSGISNPGIVDRFNKENSGLPDDYIQAMAVSGKNDVWIGTGNGLVKLDTRNKQITIPEASPFKLADMGGLAVDKDGVLWAGGISMDPEAEWFEGMGLNRWDGETWRQYRSGNSKLKEDVIEFLASDSQGRVWIGSGSKPFWREWETGLSSFDGSSFRQHGSGDRFINAECLAVDAKDRVWVGFSQPTEDGETGSGLACLEGEKWTFYTTENSGIPGDFISSLSIAKDGTLWMIVSDTSYGHPIQMGLASFDGKDWKLIELASFAMEYEYADTVAVDPEGKLWVGTYDSVYVFTFK